MTVYDLEGGESMLVVIVGTLFTHVGDHYVIKNWT